MLHLINKSPLTSNNLDSCLKFAKKDAPVLLFEDAVYGAMAGTSLEAKMTDIAKDRKVYALKEDLMARGINSVVPGVVEVDYAGFVDLVEQNNTFTWTY